MVTPKGDEDVVRDSIRRDIRHERDNAEEALDRLAAKAARADELEARVELMESLDLDNLLDRITAVFDAWQKEARAALETIPSDSPKETISRPREGRRDEQVRRREVGRTPEVDIRVAAVPVRCGGP